MKLWLCLLMLAAVPAFAQHEGHSPTSAFDRFDKNHDSSLNREEYAAYLESLETPLTPIPTVTDADRAAAFPEVQHQHAHGTGVYHYTLIDRLETDRDDNGAWEASGWIGGDIQKFLWRTEGHTHRSTVERGNVKLLYQRGIRDWWDVVAGVRHDFGEGPERNWAAVGVQGLAPGKIEVSATGYIGSHGRTMAIVEGEYETLLTNRLILQWRGEAELHGKADPPLMIGSGLSTVAIGARLRYEFHRKFAPYVGVEHERLFGETARMHRSAGEEARDTKVVFGVRTWF